MDKRAVDENRLLKWIESVGNKAPSPFLLFAILSVVIILVAGLMEGITYQIPGTSEQMEIVSLLNREGFVYILSNLMSNFISFPLIPLIVLFTLAIGVGEKSGLYYTVILRFFRKIPDKLIYFCFFFIAINGNIISDASLILLPSIGSVLFIIRKKNPAVAIMISYAGYLAGLSANTFIAGTDILSAGITESVLPLLPITADIVVHPAINWYFMSVSSFLLAAVGTFVTIRYIEPRMNRDKTITWDEIDVSSQELELTTLQKRGLKHAGITTVIYAIIVAIMLMPNGWLRDITTDSILPSSPFMNNLTVILAIYFFVVGLMYGIGAKTLTTSNDVAKAMAFGLGGITELLVVFFFAAQFVDYFQYTNIATYIAVIGADFLQATNFTGLPLLFLLLLFTAIINFFIGTVGAKWGVMAPIMVPLLALLGYHPAFAQTVYRIGDSLTNTINPISLYMPMVLVYLLKYKKDAGIGTIVSYQIPFAIAFSIVWCIQLAVWYFFSLPVGPLAPMFLN